ncbi:hypothetical protein HMPREF9302_08240 [Prevotella amnii DNF00058]|uniref:Uncharacterized protein n=1 Tax=Prevotella amnii DNF00058 TaxID=1401066 RepID=A0A096AVX5_9BACT|nr:hypothetical protein HMPREF9302_08240 [Prevotella amnii DNF00058]
MLFIIKRHSLQVKKHYKKQFFFTTIDFFKQCHDKEFCSFYRKVSINNHHIHQAITYNMERLLNLFISLLNVIS